MYPVCSSMYWTRILQEYYIHLKLCIFIRYIYSTPSLNSPSISSDITTKMFCLKFLLFNSDEFWKLDFQNCLNLVLDKDCLDLYHCMKACMEELVIKVLIYSKQKLDFVSLSTYYCKIQVEMNSEIHLIQRNNTDILLDTKWNSGCFFCTMLKKQYFTYK